MAKCVDWYAEDVAFKRIQIYAVRHGLDFPIPIPNTIHAKWRRDKMKSKNYSFTETSFSIFKTLTSNDDDKWVLSKAKSFFLSFFSIISPTFNGLINWMNRLTVINKWKRALQCFAFILASLFSRCIQFDSCPVSNTKFPLLTSIC